MRRENETHCFSFGLCQTMLNSSSIYSISSLTISEQRFLEHRVQLASRLMFNIENVAQRQASEWLERNETNFDRKPVTTSLHAEIFVTRSFVTRAGQTSVCLCELDSKVVSFENSPSKKTFQTISITIYILASSVVWSGKANDKNKDDYHFEVHGSMAKQTTRRHIFLQQFAFSMW